MKKKYRNRLPKGAEVTGFNAHIENGEIIVEVELKDKFEPKDGDFLIAKNLGVFIYNGRETDLSYGAYVGTLDGKIVVSVLQDGRWAFKRDSRFATPEEKADFLKRLETEEHRRWNADTKKLEPIRWRAEKGATYYYVDERGNVLACSDTHGCADDWRYFFRNYFRTREAAKPYAEKMKELFKNSKAE